MVRVTVKRSGGDYIRDCLFDLKPNLTSIVHDYFSESLDGEFVGDIRVYTSINPGSLIWIIIGGIVLIILYVVGFYLVIRNKNASKKKTLKESLLSEENPW